MGVLLPVDGEGGVHFISRIPFVETCPQMSWWFFILFKTCCPCAVSEGRMRLEANPLEKVRYCWTVERNCEMCMEWDIPP